MPVDYKKLDNPAWHALTEKHACFAMGTDEFKRYDPGIVLFAGYKTKKEDIFSDLDGVVGQGESIFLFDQFQALPGNYSIETVVECLQMVCDTPVPATIKENIILLDETKQDEMFELVSEVFPGYYLPQTRRMGAYVGIYINERLVAMAGERLRMDGFTEISAVVTHPEFGGRRYAQQLVTHLIEKNRQSGITPFLHTGSGNERAIAVYELLGFKKRRIIPVTRIKRVV